jgi:hypothetical protein
VQKLILQVLAAILIGPALVLGEAARASGWTITQITDNSTSEDEPEISGSNVAWAGSDGEIYFWDCARTIQISEIGNANYPHIDGSNVVWRGRDGTIDNDYEIYMTDISSILPAVSIGGLFVIVGLLGLVDWRRLRG